MRAMPSFVLIVRIALELLVTSTDGADGNTDSTGAVVDLLTAFNARRYGIEGRPSGTSAGGSNSLTSSSITSTSSSSHAVTAGTAVQQQQQGTGQSAPVSQATAKHEGASGGHRHVLFQLSSSSSDTPSAEPDSDVFGRIFVMTT